MERNLIKRSNKMKTMIKAKIPTVHKLHALNSFGLGCHHNLDGSYEANRVFNSKEDAINYLLERASLLSDSPEQYNKWEEEILKYDQMTNDAAVAHIEELDDKG